MLFFLSAALRPALLVLLCLAAGQAFGNPAAKVQPDAPRTAPLYTFRNATLLDCVDGDTCRFHLQDWHPAFGRVTFHDRRVRLDGVDAPELRHARCEAERTRALAARDRLVALLRAATAIRIEVMVAEEKYGRIIGRVWAGEQDVGAVLVAEGLARRWTGRREGWCEDLN